MLCVTYHKGDSMMDVQMDWLMDESWVLRKQFQS